MHPWAADIDAPLTIEEQFMAVNISIAIRAVVMEQEALQALDDLVELMTIRADYEFLRDSVLQIMPLGIETWVDEKLVRILAKAEGLDHIADALIDELSPKGRRDRT